ncbi:MAG: RNA pseudouridine synthase, partial [Desulfobacteraceae bacterium]
MTSHLSIAIITIGDGWLVVEKPAGISIHNDPGKDLRSRLALRVSNDQRLQRKIDFNPDYGFHAVGRLDKGADGLVLVAWRSSVFAQLAGQYARRETQKEYKALLYGQLRLDGIAVGDLLWAWSLSKGPCGRGNPAGRAPRVPCETNVNILETASNFTLVACRPSTGRKHQIRRHAALSGHPLAGDRRYGLLGAANR